MLRGNKKMHLKFYLPYVLLGTNKKNSFLRPNIEGMTPGGSRWAAGRTCRI